MIINDLIFIYLLKVTYTIVKLQENMDDNVFNGVWYDWNVNNKSKCRHIRYSC